MKKKKLTKLLALAVAMSMTVSGNFPIVTAETKSYGAVFTDTAQKNASAEDTELSTTEAMELSIAESTEAQAEEQTEEFPEEVIQSEDSPEINDVEDQQFQDITGEEENTEDEDASAVVDSDETEDPIFEDADENTDADLQNTEDLLPVDDKSKVITDPEKPECGLVIDFNLDNSELESYSDVYLNHRNQSGGESIIYNGDRYWGGYLDYYFYGKTEQGYTYLHKDSADDNLRLGALAKKYKDQYKAVRVIALPCYDTWVGGKKCYLTDSIIKDYLSAWIGQYVFQLQGMQTESYEIQQILDEGGKENELPTQDEWITYTDENENEVQPITMDHPRSVLRVQKAITRPLVVYQENGLPKGAVVVRNTGTKDMNVKIQGTLTGPTKYLYSYDNRISVKEPSRYDSLSAKFNYAIYDQSAEGKWVKAYDCGESLEERETQIVLRPGKSVVMYPPVADLYNYRFMVQFDNFYEHGQQYLVDSVSGVEGEWKREGQYWSTELSSDDGEAVNPVIDFSASETEAMPAYKDNGLPNYALLIRGSSGTQSTSGYDGEERYPGFFVKVNPCWEKMHNSQPYDYGSSGLWATCIYYKWNPYTEKYEVNTFKSTSEEEVYEDTSDYYHCFYVDPDPDEVVAIVPLACKNDCYSPFGSSSPDVFLQMQSRNYCFQYQVCLNSTQEWKMTGVQALDDQSSPSFVDGTVKGGWLTCGDGTKDHAGTVGADLEISTELETEGVRLEKGEDGFPNLGLRIDVGKLPDKGITGKLKVKINVPESYKNGESGMGFAEAGEYRTSNSYQVHWTYEITGKAGCNMMAVLYKKQDQGYSIAGTRTISVTGDEGGYFDLTGMNIESEDVLYIIPYSPDYTGTYIRKNGGEFKNKKDRMTETDKILLPSLYGSSQQLKIFDFDYSISLTGNGDSLSVIGKNETEIINDEGVYSGKAPVYNGDQYLQEVVLDVTEGESENRCGLQENGLPDYGIILLPGTYGNIVLDSTAAGGEKTGWYVFEKYKKNSSGKYELTLMYSGASATYVEIYKAQKGIIEIPKISIENDVVGVIRPFIQSEGVRERLNTWNGSWDYDWKPEEYGAYEATDNQGNVIYPQSGKYNYTYLINKSKRSQNATYYELEYLTKTNRWKTSDWENEVPEVINSVSHVYGVTGNLDYSRDESKCVVLQTLETKSVTVNELTMPEDSLPDNCLVIQNKNVGGSSTTSMADFNIRLEMAKQDNCGFGDQTGNMSFGAWLYVQDEQGNWHKAEDKNESSDWINFGAGIRWTENGILSTEYGYDVHAHLKDKEAIVIVPEYDLYTFSYTVSVRNHREFEIIDGQCQVTSDVQHPSRKVFTGTASHFPTDDPKADLLVIATSPKNVDAGGSETVSRLTNVRSLPVTLFDYDFGEWAHFVLGAQTAQYRFRYDPKNVKNTAVNTWYSNVFPGILKNQLGEDGLPVFNYTTPFSLFDTSVVPSAVNGGTKSVYQNVGFDFVYDPSANEYSYQSSINHAGYDPGTNKIYQYDKAIGIEGWDEKGAGFFPFNSFEDEGVWGTAQKNTQGIYLLDQLKTVDYHFGMSMEKEFIIPEEGTVAITDDQGNVSARKDMVFSFSGDDDAWLFVDGQLVLDMGGIHEAVSGSINFTKGTFTVTSSVTGDTRTQALSSVFTDYPEAIGKWDESAWAAGTKHTFSFFYLERGGTLSDCSIKFNLPVFKDFAVTKTVEGKETQESFDFEMELLDGQGNAYTGNLYQLIDGKRTPVENGTGKYKFQLKAGENIQFSTQQECTSYRVTETKQENWTTGWASTDGKSGAGNVTELLPTDCDVTVTNRYQEPTITPTNTPTETPTPQVTTTPAPEVSATPIPSVTVSKTPTPTKEAKPSDTPEPSVTVTEGPSGGSGNGGSGSSGYSTNSPKTGDTSDAALWQTLLLLAMGAVLITTMRIIKKKEM